MNHQSHRPNVDERTHYNNNRQTIALETEQRATNKRKVDQSWHEFNRLQQDSVMQYNKKLKMLFAPEIENITIREWIQTLPKPDVFEILKSYLAGLIKMITQNYRDFHLSLLPEEITSMLRSIDSCTLEKWQEVWRSLPTCDLREKLFQKYFYSSSAKNWQPDSIYRQFPILERMFNIHQISKCYSERHEEYSEVICEYIAFKTAFTVLRSRHKNADFLLSDNTQLHIQVRNQKSNEKLIHTALLLLFESSLTDAVNAIQTLRATSIISSKDSPHLLAVFSFKVEEVNLQPILHKFQAKINQLDFKCGKVILQDTLIVRLNSDNGLERRNYSWSELCQSNLRSTVDRRYGETIKIGKSYPLVYRLNDTECEVGGLLVVFDGNTRMPTKQSPVAQVYLHSFLGELVTNYASSALGLQVHNDDILTSFMPFNNSLVALAEYFVNWFHSEPQDPFFPYRFFPHLFRDISVNIVWWIHQYLASLHNTRYPRNSINLATYSNGRVNSWKTILRLLPALSNQFDQSRRQQYITCFERLDTNTRFGAGDWYINRDDGLLAIQYELCNAIANYAYRHRFDIAAECSLSLKLFLPKALCQLVIIYL